MSVMKRKSQETSAASGSLYLCSQTNSKAPPAATEILKKSLQSSIYLNPNKLTKYPQPYSFECNNEAWKTVLTTGRRPSGCQNEAGK